MSDVELCEHNSELHSIPGEHKKELMLQYLAEEFFGYHKTRTYTDKNGNNQEVKFYAEPSLEDIVTAMRGLAQHCEQLSGKEDQLQQTIQTNTEELYAAREQVKQFKKQNDELTLLNKMLTDGRKSVIRDLKKYGGHKPDCAYVEIAACGRIIKSAEKDNCTCGWVKTREEFKEPVDAIFEEKKEDKEELPF